MKTPMTDRLADFKAAAELHEPEYAHAVGLWTRAKERRKKLNQKRQQLSQDAVVRLRAAGLSQNAIAHAVGVTQARVSQVELGGEAFAPELLERVCALADKHAHPKGADQEAA